MSRKAFLLPIIITFVFAALSLTLISSCMPTTGASMFGDRIGLLYIEGVIMSGHQSDNPFFTSGPTSDHIVEVIEQAIDDSGIKALVVRINSPGGSAAASQEIYDAFMKFKSETGHPIIVSMADVAASGGYYVAAPADEIYANPATLTGSIGVIMQLMNYEGLYELIGLSDTTIKAGKFKDIGSGTRPMTDEEKVMLDDMVDQVHLQFMDAVVESRDSITEENIESIATGMIFNGEQALEIGLVDKLGGLRDAIDRASELAGLGDDPIIDELGQVGLLDELLGELGTVQSPLGGGFTGGGVMGGGIRSGGVAGTLQDALSPLAGQNPFYRMWSLILLDPRFVGEGSGIQF